MPERFEVVCIPCKALYKCSALPFTFTPMQKINTKQLSVEVSNNHFDRMHSTKQLIVYIMFQV